MLNNILRRHFSFVAKNKALIEIQELANIIGDSDTSIVHACMTQPNYDIKKAHITARIPNSVYFSNNDICDKTNPAPLMLPKEEQLEEPTFLHTMEAYPFSMFVIIYGLVMGLFVTMLLLFHTHLITNFKSTQEQLKKDKGVCGDRFSSSPYSY